MANFHSCPSLFRQPLSRCSLPFASSAIFFHSHGFSARHGVLRVTEEILKRRLHGFHITQHFILVPFPASSLESKVRKISSLQTGDVFHVESYCASGSRIAGLKRTESTLLHMQLICYAHSVDASLGEGIRNSSRSDSVEFVLEGAKIGSDPADEEGDAKDRDPVLTDDDVRILAQYMTRHNFVRVLEVSRSANSILAGARVLLLDKPGNIHSIYQKYRLLTESYYDTLASLPAVIPEGPIGILGLGAGTAARLIHHFWPEIDLHGWELDPGVVQVARKLFDLEELEWKDGRVSAEDDAVPVRMRDSSGSYGAWKDESDEIRLNLFQVTQTGPREGQGKLRVHVGDALSPDVTVEGGFAGIIVDLFAEGAVIPPLQQVEAWREMREKLRPGGRMIVNCGGSCVEAAGVEKKDGGITMRETVAALVEAFPGELSVTYSRDHGENTLALTGPSPDFQVWKDTLPECLRLGIEDWRPFSSWKSQILGTN